MKEIIDIMFPYGLHSAFVALILVFGLWCLAWAWVDMRKTAREKAKRALVCRAALRNSYEFPEEPIWDSNFRKHEIR